MDLTSYEKLSAVVEDLGFEITPRPAEGENVTDFDVVSDMGAISPQLLTNALRKAYEAGAITNLPLKTSAQTYCVSFEDVSVA